MRLLALPRYERLGASSRVRMYQYMPYLAMHGIHVEASAFLCDDYVTRLYSGRGRGGRILAAYSRRLRALRHIARFDLIWLEKEALPWMPAWAERRIERLRIPYIVDYDDATFHHYDSHRLPAVRGILGHKIDEVMRRAAIVVVGNDYLAGRAKTAGAQRVEIVPTVVDLDHYPIARVERNSKFTIGWIGTPVTAPYIRVAERGLAAVCRGDAGRLLTVGSGPFEMPGIEMEVREWTEATEASDMQCMDAGIMPLPATGWERGKCGYKLIQYMACEKPVAASPVGVNCQIVDHEVDGYLASTPEEWEHALISMRDDPDLRAGMGRAARDKVERTYSLQVTAPRMLGLFREVFRQ
jgi:glycosyltransferase involved in cell wall biosynthesis